MAVFTKPAAEVFAPTTAGGAPRAADMGEAQVWGVEVEAQIAAVTRVAWKDAVDFATTASITLSGSQTVDGVASGTGKRALVKDQASPAQNGIYVTAAGAWSRATDADSEAELYRAGYFVKSGTANGGRQFACTTDSPITVGTTALTFVQIGDAGDTSLTKDDVGLGNVDNTSDADKPISDATQAAFDATQLELDAKAPLASPALSGTPTAPTAALGNETTQLATTEFSANAIKEQATAYQPGYDTDDPGPFEVVGPDGYVRESPVRAEEYDTDDAARIAVVGLDGYVVSEVDDTPAIMPATVINEQAIRRSRQKLRMILRGATEQCRIAVIGDSYVNAQLPTWIRGRLVSIYGDAGPGFVSFVDASNVKCANSAVTVASTGTWTSASSGKATPRLGSESSSDTGAYKTVFGSGAITSAYLHFIAAGGATGFYRWGVYDGSGSTTDRTNYVFGSDHSLDLSTGYRISMPTDAPASGTWALEIGCSAGTIEIAGADLKNSAAGVIVDNLGVGGSATTTWLAVDGETWRTAVGSMGIDAVFILLGTNDQAGVVSDEGVAHNFASIRHRLLIALPAADVAFVSPPENFLERDRKMPDITAAVRSVAASIGATHIDLQPVFGPITSKGDYQSIGVRPLFNADDVHPETGVGDVVIADTIERLLLQ